MTTDSQLALTEFVEFLTIPERRSDPYPFYSRVRSIAPLQETSLGFWLATGYDVVSQIFRDPRFSSDERNSMFSQAMSDYAETPFGRMAQRMLVFVDDPDHKRLRDLVQKAFTRRVVEGLRQRIASLVDDLIDRILDAGRADLVTDFAYPLPVIVICELLGVPVDDRAVFEDWARDFAVRIEIQMARTSEAEERADVATTKLIDYFEGLLKAKRAHPTDDLISALVLVEDDGDRLTHDELISTCLLLLLAGHETTANLIGNGVYALLRHRDQWDRLVEDPALVRPAVEEILRFDSPVQFLQRIALEDIAVDGNTVPKGAPVALLLGAANHDPDRFRDPDRLDVGRGEAPLVAFGGGVHFCLGAPLARLETQTALAALTRRAPGLQLDEPEPPWRPTFVLRGLQRLPVRVR